MENITEIWKDIIIDGVTLDYQVSNLGGVRSFRKTCGRNGGSARRSIPRALKPCISPQHYHICKLWDDSFKKGYRQFSIQRLVYTTFVGEIPEFNEFGEYFDIDHISGDRSDNRLVNLRVVSHRFNCINSTIGEVQRKPVRSKDENGDVVKEYLAMIHAKDDGYKRESISLAIKHKRKYKNLYWEFK